jgi:hypothetical protein
MTKSQGIAVGSVLVLAVLVIIIGHWVIGHVQPDEIGLPVIAILGVLAVLCALALIAVVFTSFQIADKTQAMALPEGSIRAVIAVSLIILFAILSIHLYASLSTPGEVKSVAGLKDNDTAKQFIADLVKGPSHIVEVPSTDANKPSAYTVYYQQSRDTAGDDFAKQLLTMLGVLLTSITSFYFGAKTASSAVAQGASAAQSGKAPTGNVTLRGIDPTTFARGSNAVVLTITGDGLDFVKSVKVATGSNQVEATGVTSSSNTVQGSLVIGANLPAGTWDVIVTDGAGNVTRLPGALNVT